MTWWASSASQTDCGGEVPTQHRRHGHGPRRSHHAGAPQTARATQRPPATPQRAGQLRHDRSADGADAGTRADRSRDNEHPSRRHCHNLTHRTRGRGTIPHPHPREKLHFIHVKHSFPLGCGVVCGTPLVGVSEGVRGGVALCLARARRCGAACRRRGPVSEGLGVVTAGSSWWSAGGLCGKVRPAWRRPVRVAQWSRLAGDVLVVACSVVSSTSCVHA